MTIEIKVPALGESVSEASIAKLHKKVGDIVKADELILELETDKVTLEVNAPKNGVISDLKVKEGDSVKVGDLVALMQEGGSVQAKPVASSQGSTNMQASVAPNKISSQHELSPAPKKLATENNINTSLIAGTGKDGRVTKGDVLDVIANGTKTVARQNPLQATGSKPTERVKMSKLRQKIAERLKESQNTAAILTTFNEVDMGAVMALRSEYKDVFEKKHGVKLGFMSFFVKACIVALKEIPAVNAEIDGTDIVYKNFYDIGVAVGSPQGLVVPVLRDADKLNLAGIEKGISELGVKARDGKLTLPDLAGATFTISNGGVYGSLMSTPIINPPQSGILGMHKIQERPMAINGEIKIRPMMYLALSYDHRIIDGKEAVTFLVRIKELLEDPRRLVLDI
ncbi:MAG: 2-oxoglutarate dehydrogenase complex dihydrolipoyllysine-residue succinyltransferase [Proteobacteria bacterium]|nr:2-oxoglutarate dehydrogenase complex dihydrolipoyllysine-residue succinyltransferase [Pseudomonadota bacterium]NCA28804.1 2-oxoglutarate dehydrogenase complex dihydrolipoyllysine-residue succinyltransferase [Pseudomonadota bacterium]